MATKVQLIKTGIAVVTIVITAMNIFAVSSYENRLAYVDADLRPPDESVYGQPAENNGDQPLQNNEDQSENGESTEMNSENSFIAMPISDEIRIRMTGKSYPSNAGIGLEDLSYISVLYYGFDGRIHEGEMIVNKLVAADILEIFQVLYDKKYPIATMALIDNYDGNDDRSMAANNSSAFCWREVAGSPKLSMHAYGLAVDINPVQNPMVITEADGTQIIKPPEGEDYLDRNAQVQGLIIKGDACYEAFISHGWQWGGEWTSLKDYQHFYKNVAGYPQE